MAYSPEQNKMQSKLKNRCHPCLFLSRAKNRPPDTSRFYDVATKAVIQSQDVRWMGVFYGEYTKMPPEQFSFFSVDSDEDLEIPEPMDEAPDDVIILVDPNPIATTPGSAPVVPRAVTPPVSPPPSPPQSPGAPPQEGLGGQPPAVSPPPDGLGAQPAPVSRELRCLAANTDQSWLKLV